MASAKEVAAVLLEWPQQVSHLCCPLQGLYLSFHHHQPQLGNCLGRIESLRASFRAVHDGMAPVEPEWVFKNI